MCFIPFLGASVWVLGVLFTILLSLSPPPLLFFLFLFFFETESCYVPWLAWNFYIGQVVLEFTEICLTMSPECY